MSKVKRIEWSNRLGRMLKDPGGITVRKALEQADENLESIREQSLAAIDARLEQIQACNRAAGKDPTEAAKAEIYAHANEIHGVAGTFGLHQMGEVAFSLCELVDRLRERGAWSSQGVEVHVAALRLFRTPNAKLDAKQVIAGLHRVTDQEGR
jgi:hypothetical protein